MIDLTLTAAQDGSEESDGMTFDELEEALRRGRAMGAQGSTKIRAAVNRNRRLRTLTIEVRPGDSNLLPAGYVAPEHPEDPAADGEVPDGHVPGQTALDEV